MMTNDFHWNQQIPLPCVEVALINQVLIDKIAFCVWDVFVCGCACVSMCRGQS